MIKRSIHLFVMSITISAALLTIPPIQSVHASTLTVNTLIDENDLDCADGDCSLRDAIDLANSSGDTISFSVNGTITLTLGQLIIGKDLTIAGPGAELITISGGNTSRVFFINNSSVTVLISGLTVANGKVTDDDGGGIRNQGTLTLDHMIVDNNSAISSSSLFVDGGGIYNTKALTITNSQITNNEANFTGGGISDVGSTLNLSNVTISGNNVIGSGGGGSGGAIAVINSSSVAMDSVSITSNTAKNAGGMYINNVATFDMSNSTISSNFAEDAIGGVWFSSTTGTYDVQNSTISGNQQTLSSTGLAGGLWVDGSLTANLFHVTITQNTVEGTGGGAGIYVTGGTPTVNLKNSIVAANISSNSNDEDCNGAITSLDYNLIQDADGNCTISGATTHNITSLAPMLNSLANNGGPTQTHSLQAGSPALNAIPNATGGCSTTFTTDQRNASRPQAAFCDIGAFEVDPSAPTVISIMRVNANPTTASSVDFTVTFSEVVRGVNTSDFTLTTTGVSGTAVSGVSGSGTTYSVSVNTGLGAGTLRLDLIDDDSIIDTGFNPLGGFGTGNGSFIGDQTYTINKSPIFADVPFNHFANSFIERLNQAGITGGCSISPLNYCPENTVTRDQMAIFLERGIQGSSFTPPNVSPTFGDTAGNFAEDWIEVLKTDGITGGCGNGNYCPSAGVTRAQMAIFLERAMHGSSFTPPNISPTFGDTAGNFAEDWIEALKNDGITSGCGNGNYCPDDVVTRAQMAIFLVKAFGLP